MGLDLDVEALKKQIQAYSDKVESKIDMLVDLEAKSLETYMKKNRKWTDRTARARQSLRGEASKDEQKYVWEITLSHGVYYGRYLESTNNPNWSTGELSGIDLEFKFEKKWAIINPTIRLKAPEVIEKMEKFLDGIKI